MALTTLEREAFKRAIADEAASEEILTIIEAGSTGTLSDVAQRALYNALGQEFGVTATDIVGALESGSATLSDQARKDCQRLMGDLTMGNNLVTELEAIT